MVRPVSRLLLTVAATVGFLLTSPDFAQGDDDKVNVSKEELEALKRKAAETDRLKEQLEQAQREIKTLKGTQSTPVPPPLTAPAPAVFPSTGGKPPVWVPPAAVRALTNQPPTPPLVNLPTVGPDTVISAHDLVTYFETDPAAAAAQFKGRSFAVRGVVTDLRKTLFSSPYEVNLRLLDSPLRVTCTFRPPDEYRRVYVSGNGEEMVGETYNSHTVFARVGAELTIRGYCEGLKDGAVRFSNCTYLVPTAPVR